MTPFNISQIAALALKEQEHQMPAVHWDIKKKLKVGKTYIINGKAYRCVRNPRVKRKSK